MVQGLYGDYTVILNGEEIFLTTYSSRFDGEVKLFLNKENVIYFLSKTAKYAFEGPDASVSGTFLLQVPTASAPLPSGVHLIGIGLALLASFGLRAKNNA